MKNKCWLNWLFAIELVPKNREQNKAYAHFGGNLGLVVTMGTCCLLKFIYLLIEVWNAF